MCGWVGGGGGLEEVEFFRGFVGPRLECPRSPIVAARGAERAPRPPRTCAALLDRPTEKSVGLTGLKAAVGGMFLSFERIEELRARIVFTPKLVFNKASFSNLRLPSSRFFSIWRSFAFFLSTPARSINGSIQESSLDSSLALSPFSKRCRLPSRHRQSRPPLPPVLASAALPSPLKDSNSRAPSPSQR